MQSIPSNGSSSFAVSLVIPVRNEGTRLAACVQSAISGRKLLTQIEFVIVDDGSDDGCCDSLCDSAVGDGVSLTFLRWDGWHGIPAARNAGANRARHPLLLITDANVTFPYGWDEALSSRFRPDRIFAFTIADASSTFRGHGCQLLLPSMGVTWIPIANAYGGAVPISPCTGTAIARDLFHALGGFDESLPYYGAAESEFSVRAWLGGTQIDGLPELVLTHAFKAPGDHSARLKALEQILLRNYIRFACYYLPEVELNRTLAHYRTRASGDFVRAWDEVNGSDVWSRRAQLACLPRDFTWFSTFFFVRGTA